MLAGHGDLADPKLRDTLLSLRAYRLAAGFLTGAALAVGGVLVQGLFRNPLASPSILGTTAGASFGGQAALLLYQLILSGVLPAFVVPELLLPVGCLLGALCALLILLAIARTQGDLVLLLLSGFILSSLFLGLGNLMMSMAQDKWELGRAMVSFVLGGITGTGGKPVAVALPLIGTGVIAAWFWGRPLDVMLSGEEESQSLGVDVDAVRRWVVAWTAVLTGAAVSLAGNIGFVGLIVPHALRNTLGYEHRSLIPAASIGGGSFVVLCDVATRLIPSRTEVPLGVVTGLIGAPLFLVLLMRTWRGDRHD